MDVVTPNSDTCPQARKQACMCASCSCPAISRWRRGKYNNCDVTFMMTITLVTFIVFLEGLSKEKEYMWLTALMLLVTLMGLSICMMVHFKLRQWNQRGQEDIELNVGQNAEHETEQGTNVSQRSRTNFRSWTFYQIRAASRSDSTVLPIDENLVNRVIEDLREDLTENRPHDVREELPEYGSHSRSPPENIFVNPPPYEARSPMTPVPPPSYEEVISERSCHMEAEVNEK